MSHTQQQLEDIYTGEYVVIDAIRGNVNAVSKWLHGDWRYNVNTRAVVLRRAAVKGHTDIWQMVIDCATVSTDDLTHALHLVCYWGHLSVMQLIVSTLVHHCNTQLLDDCLHLAVLQSQSEIMHRLLPLTHPTDANYMKWDLVQASARGDWSRITQLVNKI
jgi:hypothetical protein